MDGTPSARGQFGRTMASPKDPVDTAGINKTSLPLPGSNCCLEKKKSSFEGEDEETLLFRCVLCPKCRRRLGGFMSTEAETGATGAGFQESAAAWGAWTSWLALGGRAFWSPWCATQEKPVATGSCALWHL